MLPSAEADDQEQPPPLPPPRSRWAIVSPSALLTILALINFLNYVDRFVISALTKSLEVDLGLSKGQIGSLQTAFMVVHSLASVPLGYLADRYLRSRLIAGGVAVWSLATAAAAFAQSFGQMFGARAAVGIGEATYAPAASALISDRFPARLRARVLGVFQLGMVLGGAVGIIAGGLVAARWGWRAAFLVVGIPGLLLSALALLIHEAPVTARRRAAAAPTSTTSSLRVEPDTPGSWMAMAWITAAGIFITFFTGAVTFWAPTFILETIYGGNKDFMGKVVSAFGPLTIVASIAGVLAGATIADRLERARPGTGRLLTIALGILFSLPCATIAFQTHTGWVQYLMLALGVFFNVWYVGPILAALHDVVPPRLRATATGAYFLLIHLLGDAISPWIVGRLGTVTGSLRTGLLVSTAVLGLGAIACFIAMPASRQVAAYKRDRMAKG